MIMRGAAAQAMCMRRMACSEAAKPVKIAAESGVMCPIDKLRGFSKWADT